MRTFRQETTSEDVWQLALSRCEEIFALYNHVIVSFSGGKDSTATLHAALDTATKLGRLPLEVHFFDEEGIPFETEEYVRRIANRDDINLKWYCVPFACRNACDPSEGDAWWPWAPESEAEWCRPLPPEALTTHPSFPPDTAPKDRPGFPESALHGYTNTAALLGIRADESITRRRAVSMQTHHNWIKSGDAGNTGNVKAYPIYDMGVEDLWLLVKKEGWDYCTAYDYYEMLGVPAPSQRLAPPFGEEPLKNLALFAQAFPELWDRLQSRVPGADTAARYARSEVWAYDQGKVELPEGETWPQYVKRLMMQHPDPVPVAKRLAAVINTHRRKTTDPILGLAPHPASGVSWKRLAVIAESGDTMGRKAQNIIGTMNQNPAKHRLNYETELNNLTPSQMKELRP